MGSFTEGQPLEALDVPPENVFDVQSFTSGIIAELQAKGVLPKDAADALSKLSNPWAAFFGVLAALAWPTLQKLEGAGVDAAEPFLKELLGVVTTVFKPLMRVLGDLTGVYVQQFVDQQKAVQPGAGGKAPSGLLPTAAGLFDSILAPLGFLVGGANPSQVGAGETNSQYVLGSIIGIHLSTWMVNIISNLTGLGALKWINSFDDVITGAISSRGLSRMAMKPYLTKFIGDPLARDLNLKLPLEIGSPAGLIKRYIRGNMSGDELKQALRGKGYDDAVVEDLLLDTVKYPTLDAIGWLVKSGFWQDADGIAALTQMGYDEDMAIVILKREVLSEAFAQMHSLATSLVDAFIDRRLDNETLRSLLSRAGFSEAEVEAMSTRGAILQELSRRLSLGQVKSLFQESLIDLDYVLNFLREEGYSDDDADLLALLEFTVKEEREARKRELAERRRVAADAAREAAALREARQAKEAAALGIPWPPA
jgi:hypothetical protein